ncbi:hypothetical protein HPB47_025397 [Ixodes persulcatus]|uniref:Uncharacterized protein n=1 Tax=Ixodes persulcatus TaxID=34615 RepID=A0AC60Q1L3_IXOPE|nr:hypothetical protein HPB47_025397 [Ixodes persulcatus]
MRTGTRRSTHQIDFGAEEDAVESKSGASVKSYVWDMQELNAQRATSFAPKYLGHSSATTTATLREPRLVGGGVIERLASWRPSAWDHRLRSHRALESRGARADKRQARNCHGGSVVDQRKYSESLSVGASGPLTSDASHVTTEWW